MGQLISFLAVGGLLLCPLLLVGAVFCGASYATSYLLRPPRPALPVLLHRLPSGAWVLYWQGSPVPFGDLADLLATLPALSGGEKQVVRATASAWAALTPAQRRRLGLSNAT